jgi:hypothetical protein
MRKVVFLMVLVGILGVIVQYNYGTPGESIVDRVRAKAVVLDFDSLNPEATPAQIQESWHQLHYTCTPEQGPLGNHVCWAPISDFNTVKARIIAFFFRDGHLSVVRVSFAPENHPEIFSLLEKRFGDHRVFGANRDSYGNNIVGWMRPSGVVAVNDQVGPKQEALVLWLSRDQLLRQGLGIQGPEAETVKSSI